jgi:hypothetical protein
VKSSSPHCIITRRRRSSGPRTSSRGTENSCCSASESALMCCSMLANTCKTRVHSPNSPTLRQYYIVPHFVPHTASHTVPRTPHTNRGLQTRCPKQLVPTTCSLTRFPHALSSLAHTPPHVLPPHVLPPHVPPVVSHPSCPTRRAPSLLVLAIHPKERGSQTCPRGDEAERIKFDDPGQDQVRRPRVRGFWVVLRGGCYVSELDVPEDITLTKILPPIRLRRPASGF